MNVYNLCTLQYNKGKKVTELYFLDGKTSLYQGKPWQFLNEICMLHGSDLQGRMKSAKYVLKIQKKVPVLTCLYMECIFFPTHGYNSDDCVWIQSRMIMKVQRMDDSNCEVYFLDGHHISLPVGHRVILRQMLRCEEYYEKITMPVQLAMVNEHSEQLCYTKTKEIGEDDEV